MPDEKLLSDTDLELISCRAQYEYTRSLDVDFLLAHIEVLTALYSEAMESARRQAWFVADWHFDESDDEDLAANCRQWVGEWTDKLKAMGGCNG